MTRKTTDVLRVLALLLIATAMLYLSVPIAKALHAPELAPWGMFTGLVFFGIALSHVARRLLFPSLDLKAVATEARKSPAGAGLVFLGVCVVLAALLALLGNPAHAEEPPAAARQYLPVLQAEQRAWWPDMPLPSALGAQVEQETCISLRHSRCWSPRAELRTSRERGVGLGQITKTARFDSLLELQRQFPAALAGWGWDDSKLYDARFQLRGLVLMDVRNWRVIAGAATPLDRLAMTLAAYNGGLGGLSSDRTVCRATPGCDPGRWFGHVERTSNKPRAAASGYGQSFFAINREYVSNVLVLRRRRYINALDGAI